MKMPLIKYPSTIVWIDDSPVFLKSIQYNNKLNGYTKTFLCPIESLTYLKSQRLKEGFIYSCKNYEESDLINHALTDINFKNICLTVNSNEISDEVSVIVVDQSMPNMNGIELCRQLKHMPFKKILLKLAPLLRMK